MNRQNVNADEVIADLRAIRRILDRLTGRLGNSISEGADPYQRRRAILQKMYQHQQQEIMTRQEILPILESHGTDYRWIAQQVKKGYVIVLPTPDGEPRYAVTAKAVRELRLSPEESAEELGEGNALAKLSQGSFAEDWDSPEDAIYDTI